MRGKLRIDTGGENSVKHWKIFLDEVDISRFVRSIKINADPSMKIHEIQIELAVYADFLIDTEGNVSITRKADDEGSNITI